MFWSASLLKMISLQTAQARKLLNSLTIAEPGWVGIATILELVWVLTSSIRLGRDAVARITCVELLHERHYSWWSKAETIEKALPLAIGMGM